MPSIKTHCPQCNSLLVVIGEEDLRPLGIDCIIYKLKCGHSTTETTLSIQAYESAEKETESFKGRNYTAMDYQIEGVKFAEHSNIDCLIGDVMGLGKTCQGLLTYARNKEKLSPTLIVCKSSLQINWIREYMQWVLKVDPLNNEEIATINPKDIPFVHPEGSLPLFPGFNVYLVSMGLLMKPEVLKSIKAFGFKCLIVDECHNFNDPNSKRTKALQEIAALIPHKIFLSGTPILNKTLDYFVTLNILKPNYFPTRKYFAERFLDWDWKTKRWLGFTEYGKQKFFEMTKDFIIRRTTEDVQNDLPEIFIQPQIIENTDKGLAKEYNKLADELEEALNDKRNRASNSSTMLGLLANLRHLTGLMKVPYVIEHIKEHMENTDEKYCLGIHHKLVRQLCMQGLAEFNPIELSGEDNPLEKDRKEQLFKTPERRLMIANILAGGEGLNFQFCNNAGVMERQWNPGKEAQFIKRFHRKGQKKTCFIGMFRVADTIDEFFETLIELKGNIVDSSLDSDVTMDVNFVRQLAQMVVSKRLKYVGL